MPIVSGDILFKLTGAATHDAATPTDPNLALGNFRTSVNVVDATDNNLFDDVSGAESDAGDTEYRGVGVLNNHGSLTLSVGSVWISVDTGNGEDDISYDAETPSASETTGAIQTISDESTGPTGRTWIDGTTKGTGHIFPGAGQNLAAGEWFGLWIRRVIAAAASAAAAESVTFRVEGDTPA